MRSFHVLTLCVLALLCAVLPAQSQTTSVAQTPPMGWNSYNCFGSAVHEDEVKANADYMAQKLKPYGWQYIVVDFLWAYDNPPGSNIGSIPQRQLEDGSLVPWLAMDAWGRLLPHVNKFPSAFGGKGFGPLSTYVHGLGLKFGIHIMRGIPRQAVWAKTPVLGAPGITADMIADTHDTCTWNNHMYGLDMRKPGAQQYLNSLLALYAQWGVDFIKVDDLSRPYSTAEVDGYRKAIDAGGRPVVFSLSPGATPLEMAAHVQAHGNMWRMADDFWDNWAEVLHMFELGAAWQGKGDAGHWPDCDMLQIGKLSKRGPVGPERYSRFTDNELYTHMTFWCLFRSPLMMGGNLPENRPLDEKLLTNSEVLAVNQTGAHPRQLLKTADILVWVSDAADGKSYNVGIFNLRDNDARIAVPLAALGIKGKALLRDLWQHQDLGNVKQYSVPVGAHGAVLLKCTPAAR